MSSTGSNFLDIVKDDKELAEVIESNEEQTEIAEQTELVENDEEQTEVVGDDEERIEFERKRQHLLRLYEEIISLLLFLKKIKNNNNEIIIILLLSNEEYLEIEKIINDLKERYEGVKNEKLVVLIAGNGSSGKSTFMNLLLRRHIINTKENYHFSHILEFKNSKFNPDNNEEVHNFDDYENYNPNDINTFNKLSLVNFQKTLDNLKVKDPKRNFVIFINNNNMEEDNLLNNPYIDISFVEMQGIDNEINDKDFIKKCPSKYDCIIFLVEGGRNLNTTVS